MKVSLLLLAIYALILFWGLSSEQTWDDDCPGRYYNVKNALNDPSQFLSRWNRPLFTALFVLPLQLGKEMIVIQMALISCMTCLFLYLATKNWLVIPFTAFQTFFFPISTNALAEPLAACLIAIGYWAYRKKRHLVFVIAGALLPLARMELLLLLPIWAWWLFKEKQYKMIPLFALPTLIWYLFYPELLANSGINRYGQTEFLHYFRRYIYVVGPAVFYFLMIGLFERVKKMDFVFLQFVAGFMIYVIFSWKLSIGNSAGFLRHMIVLTPLVGVLAVEGFEFWRKYENEARTLIYSAVIFCISILLCKTLVMHHSIGGPNPINAAFVIVLSFMVVWRRKETWGKYVVIALIVGYTLFTEPPDANANLERKAVKALSDWYVDNVPERKVYSNHVWFFWVNDLDYINRGKMRIQELDSAKTGEIVFWETHYSNRLNGNVPSEYFTEERFRLVGDVETGRFKGYLMEVHIQNKPNDSAKDTIDSNKESNKTVNQRTHLLFQLLFSFIKIGIGLIIGYLIVRKLNWI